MLAFNICIYLDGITDLDSNAFLIKETDKDDLLSADADLLIFDLSSRLFESSFMQRYNYMTMQSYFK